MSIEGVGIVRGLQRDTRAEGDPRARAVGHPWYPPSKRIADATLAVVLLIVTAPLILLAMALVKLTSRGPALYWQVRAGLGGKPFTIYKLRTMAHNCEARTGPVWSTGRDPRVTPLGRFLRRTHLDEFPQLWNVLRGEMSLVGPRPERPEFVAQLQRAIPQYGRRLSVPPGVTGLAQVHLPADSDLAGVRRKLVYDLYYIQRMSLWLDLQLMLCTALLLVGIPFSISRRLLLVPASDTVEGDRPSLKAEVEAASQMQPA